MKNTTLFEDVHQVVRLIPSGRATSYGAIAKYLGMNRGARMVGWAMNGASKNSDVPAHRVVNRLGLLTGRHQFTPPEKMQISLENEGLEIVNHQIKNFDKVFWDPSEELEL
jgi:methylated-DNA-protein-cysteine methyltransferase-like protein